MTPPSDRNPERAKMLAGELYDPMDAELVAGRERARNLCLDLNATRGQRVDEGRAGRDVRGR